MQLLKGYTNLPTTIIISVLIAIVLALLTIVIGNIPLFLQMNGNGGFVMDTVMLYITKTGEIVPWIVALIYMLLYKKKQWKILVYAFVFSTILVQGLKNLLPQQERPTKAIANLQQVHTVSGVELHQVFSFPSGHTTTAFTILFVAIIFIKNKYVAVVGLLYAIAVAYSRIYLAQHFPKDIAGGIVCAIVAIFLALWAKGERENNIAKPKGTG